MLLPWDGFGSGEDEEDDFEGEEASLLQHCNFRRAFPLIMCRCRQFNKECGLFFTTSPRKMKGGRLQGATPREQ